MKKLLSILLLSVVLIGCSEERVILDELIDRGTKESPLMYSESGLFTGGSFDIYPNGQLKEEANWKDGKKYGLSKAWYDNGRLRYEQNWKDGKRDGLSKDWYKDVTQEVIKPTKVAISKITYTAAQNFMKERCASLNQELMLSKIRDFDGAKLYMFLSVHENGLVCVSSVSEYVLEVMAADCGSLERKMQEWNAF